MCCSGSSLFGSCRSGCARDARVVLAPSVRVGPVRVGPVRVGPVRVGRDRVVFSEFLLIPDRILPVAIVLFFLSFFRFF